MFITKMIEQKRRWWQYKARKERLPADYHAAMDALERYLMYCGGGGGTAMFEDLIDLFEQSAASRTPIREIVGEDPVEFIETFARNYSKDSWMVRERERLTGAIERAVGEQGEN